MMSSADRRRLAFFGLCCFASACTTKADPRIAARDPGAPAVVQAPRVTVPLDTIGRTAPSRDPAPSGNLALDDARRTISSNFAVLGAAIIFGDPRTIASSYAPDAEVITPDTTYKGIAAIVNGLGRLASGKSLREFERRSLASRIVDSTVVDSGVYVVTTKRTGADSVLERGHYATTWRMLPAPRDWVITRDHLYRDAPKKAK
jgi:hypothetical protein